ncbi:MAG: hypothetical protein HZR80_00055 [Candidatus Heimdallarchaeota archaeon]
MTSMGYSEVISKNARDKNGKKLGKVYGIKKPYAYILTRDGFRTNIKVAVELDDILMVKEKDVWFDISKKDFDKERKKLKKMQAIQEEMYPKTEPARFLFFSNQRAENIPKQQKRE